MPLRLSVYAINDIFAFLCKILWTWDNTLDLKKIPSIQSGLKDGAFYLVNTITNNSRVGNCIVLISI